MAVRVIAVASTLSVCVTIYTCGGVRVWAQCTDSIARTGAIAFRGVPAAGVPVHRADDATRPVRVAQVQRLRQPDPANQLDAGRLPAAAWK